MNIVVTGASGFIGGHIARSFATLGHRVVAINRSVLPKYNNIHPLICDLISSIPEEMHACDMFIHCAALADFDADFESAYQGNVIVTRNAYAYAAKVKAKVFIHISSASVYVESVDKYRVCEDFPFGVYGGNAYAKTKRLAEEYLACQNQVPIICLRPHSVYGAGDTSVLKKLLAKLRFNALFLPLNQPKELSITHVGNIVEAVKFFMTRRPAKRFEVFNVADEKYVNSLQALTQLLEAVNPDLNIVKIPAFIGYGVAFGSESIASILHKRPILTSDVVFQLNHHSSISIEKIKSCGFTPKYEMSDGLNDISDWMKLFKDSHHFVTDNQIWPNMIQSNIIY